MSSMEAFYTRDKANEGKRIPLFAPDGSATDSWLDVRHVWSDAFSEAEESAKLELSEFLRAELATRNLEDDAKMPEDLKTAIKAESKRLRLDVLASLIAGWSFGDCTPQAARDFLQRAPQVADQVDKIAGDTKRFFGDGSAPLKRGSGKKKS